MGENKYRSKFEERIAKQIRESGVKVLYETQSISYIKPVTKHKYTPDFILPNNIYIETKGRFTLYDRKKHLLIKEQHPELDIRIVFQNSNNKITKGSKTTYGEWCDKNNIKWADGKIPSEWYKENNK